MDGHLTRPRTTECVKQAGMVKSQIKEMLDRR